MRSMLKKAIFVMALAAAGAAPAQESSSPEAAPVARPTRPERPAAPAVSAGDCATPSIRDRLLADPEAVIRAAGSYGTALNAYSDQLMRWRGDQLVRSGRWTRDDERAFAMRILDDPEFGREAEAGMAMAGEVMQPMIRVADESLPPEERCRSLIAAQDVFDRITASIETQYGIIDRLFEAETQRLGVSLD